MEDGKWIVFDFGGGTFDVAMTGIINDEMEVLDHKRDNFLGGKDIDRAIVEHFVIHGDGTCRNFYFTPNQDAQYRRPLPSPI